MTAPAPPNWTTRAIDGAVDLTKQVLTLSTGVLTLTLTFYNNFFGKPSGEMLVVPTGAKVSLGTAWLLFILSILAGLLVLAKFTGEQGNAGDGKEDAAGNPVNPTVNEAATMRLGIAQWMLFFLGMIAVGVGGVFVLLP